MYGFKLYADCFEMYGSVDQPVLRCEQCNKPFDKSSTLKRHGYYCRSRGSTTSKTLIRACSACVSRKTRCDKRRPQCGRCISKAIRCDYPVRTAKTRQPTASSLEDAPAEAESLPYPWEARLPPVAPNDGDVVVDGSTPSPSVVALAQDVATSVGELAWDDPDIDFGDFLIPQVNSGVAQDASLRLSFGLSQGSHPSNVSDEIARMQGPIHLSEVSLPRAPTNTFRSLIPRSRPRLGAQRIATLILHNLKSYPLMMVRENTLPPFTHRSWIPSNGEEKHMESLDNCFSLMHMISRSSHGSRKLFWKNVKMECERLRAEHWTFNKYELLTGMQALLVFFLIRLGEGETEYNNYDALMLTTVTMLSQRAHLAATLYDLDPAIHESELGAMWNNWIYEESARRLCLVYQVMNKLVYFEPAKMCILPSDLDLAPLPFQKQLWEAADEFAWKAEIDRSPGAQIFVGLATNGELVELDDWPDLYSNAVPVRRQQTRPIAKWEQWCSGMDEFGGLVMLAATLAAS